MLEDGNEIIESILTQKEEELITYYSKIKKKNDANNNIYEEIKKIDNIDNETKEKINTLLAEYLDQKNIEVAQEIKFYYKNGFKDGAKVILEIFKKG